MRNRLPSSPPSAPCRLDWRPSRWLIFALSALLPLAGGAIWRCGLAPIPALALAALVTVRWGMLICREWRRPAATLVIPWNETAVTVDGKAVHDFRIQWHGPLAMLSWAGKGRRREWRLFWPDTLPPAARRELRLAADARAISSRASQMAP